MQVKLFCEHFPLSLPPFWALCSPSAAPLPPRLGRFTPMLGWWSPRRKRMFIFSCMFSFFLTGSTQDNFCMFANVFFHLCFSLLAHSPDLDPNLLYVVCLHMLDVTSFFLRFVTPKTIFFQLQVYIFFYF